MTQATTTAPPKIHWILRAGKPIGWLCVYCSTEHPGVDQQAKDAADQHNCNRVRILRELVGANKVIEDADAVVTEDDGFRWVDTAKLPAEFVEYYASLTTTAYALGALRLPSTRNDS